MPEIVEANPSQARLPKHSVEQMTDVGGVEGGACGRGKDPGWCVLTLLEPSFVLVPTQGFQHLGQLG
ncbi:MAG: hypothetical protein CL471_03200 [Acidobacteria bacterium]|nr:hypothetical protein [Acidobacteriota bacterium]